MTLMAQGEFYFAKGFSYMSGILSHERNFMILLQFCYSAGKTILLARSIFSKDYSLKEQTWLVTYAVHCPRNEEVQTAAFIPTSNAISKRPAHPCLFFYSLHNLSPCNDKESENWQANCPPWVDRESTDLTFTGRSWLFRSDDCLRLLFILWWRILHKRHISKYFSKLLFWIYSN